jgi:catechol 2,3-dioxygenase-like lactoylglutathione lyase family enzyme
MLADFPSIPILLSTDMAESKRFYQGTLGLPLLDETDERMVFKCGGDTRLIISRSTVGTSDTQTQMVWRVPDIHAALADLRARGVRIEQYTAPDPVTDSDGIADMGHSWAAWFIDPSRNVLSVIEPKG